MTFKTVAIAAGLSLAGIAAAQADGNEPPNGVPNGPTGYSERILQLETPPAYVDQRRHDKRAVPYGQNHANTGNKAYVDQRRHDRRGVPYGQNHTRTSNRAYLNGYTTFEALDSIR